MPRKLGVCVTCEKTKQIAAHGLCFVCNRKATESRDPAALRHRRAQRRSHARRVTEGQRLEKRRELLGKISQIAEEVIMSYLSETDRIQARTALQSEFRQLFQNWQSESQRRLSLIFDMEDIEKEGKTPVVVAKEDIEENLKEQAHA